MKNVKEVLVFIVSNWFPRSAWEPKAEECVGGPGHTHDVVEQNNDLKLALLDNADLRINPMQRGQYT